MKKKYLVISFIIIVILILLLSMCNRKYSKNKVDVFNININDMKDNCKVVNGTVLIDDEVGNYIYQYDLNIFNNNVFKDKIAPGISGSYLFNIHNISNIDIKYSIMMDKVSEYDINLKYRLKKNNKYIIGDDNSWVDIKLLNTNNYILKKDKTDKYVLEWIWLDDDKMDTIIGINMVSKYLLNINFYMEEVDSK